MYIDITLPITPKMAKDAAGEKKRRWWAISAPILTV